MHISSQHKRTLNSALKKKGLRPTKQRSCIYKVILEKKDHPTAEDILFRVRQDLPTISLATVYNCLETLVDCGLVRQVNFDRSSTRFCPNLTPHAHFKCSESGNIFDIEIDNESLTSLKSILPAGFQAESFELSFSGVSKSLNN